VSPLAGRTPRVLAVGDAIVDLVTPPLLPIPAEDFQWEISELSVLPGGNATNFALQMAALGARTTFVGCVGDDLFSEVLKDAYDEAGLISKLRVDAKRPTGHTVALTWARGSRGLITAVGANATLRGTDVPASAIDSADHVHRAGFWWTPALSGEPTADLLARAQRADVTTSLDISTDPEGWPSKRVKLVRTCLPHVDTFFGNETEVCAIAGPREPVVAAERLVDLGVGEVVLHRGDQGSQRIGEGKLVSVPAFAVPAPDNPTGCGDVFNAGYVFARLTGASLSESLGFGNACAALHLVDRNRAYPSLRDIRAFLRGAA
jgi:sugar/nucleoside kinase (ribokinase family)